MRTLHAFASSALSVALFLALAPQGAAAQTAATMPPVVTAAPSGNPMGATANPMSTMSANPFESGAVPGTPNPFASPTPTPLLETETTTTHSGGAWGLLGLLGLLGLIGLRGSSRPT
jgi:hypothetical protein